MSGYFSFMQKAAVLDKFGENWRVIASKRAVVLLDHHNTQRGEAQLTYKNGGLSLPTSVTELVADPPNFAPSVVHDTVTALFARLPHHHRRPMSGKGSATHLREHTQYGSAQTLPLNDTTQQHTTTCTLSTHSTHHTRRTHTPHAHPRTLPSEFLCV